MVEHESFGKVRFLIDGPAPGSGETFDWNILREMPINRQFILAGGLNPENVVEAILAVNPWGVDAVTGVEERPGIKDASLVRQFIVNARSVPRSQTDAPLSLSDDWEDTPI